MTFVTRQSRHLALIGTMIACFGAAPVNAQTCGDLETFAGGDLHAALQAALGNAAPDAASNGGLNTDMWGTIVDRDGVVCAVARTGAAGEQWPGSRVISAQKANTANAFSLPGLALSTANLYAAVQPGGSLFGLQESNPVDTSVAYVGSSATWGTPGDDLVGEKIGGVNVFGGGLALYQSGILMGALGVSGDTSCADHIIAWRVRNELDLDGVPGGVSATGDDNVIFDIVGGNGNFASKSGFGHPECGFGETPPAEALPASFPIE
jgi:uncharacterized protein GlcG (DUF336 family)